MNVVHWHRPTHFNDAPGRKELGLWTVPLHVELFLTESLLRFRRFNQMDDSVGIHWPQYETPMQTWQYEKLKTHPEIEVVYQTVGGDVAMYGFECECGRRWPDITVLYTIDCDEYELRYCLNCIEGWLDAGRIHERR